MEITNKTNDEHKQNWQDNLINSGLDNGLDSVAF